MAASRILEYLTEHPDAKDTVDGITEWWHPGSGAANNPADVKEALRFLTGRGLLVERRRGGTRLYAFGPGRMDEAAALLEALRHR